MSDDVTAEGCVTCKYRTLLRFRPSPRCDLFLPPWAEAAIGARDVDRQVRDDDWCSFYTRRADT